MHIIIIYVYSLQFIRYLDQYIYGLADSTSIGKLKTQFY